MKFWFSHLSPTSANDWTESILAQNHSYEVMEKQFNARYIHCNML